jgi:cob(I)alamin adenosyltransferase
MGFRMTTESDVAEIKLDMAEVKAAIARIEQHLFFGNGDRPLTSRVEMVESQIARLSSTWNSVTKFILALTSALVLSAGGFVWALLTHTITLTAKGP